MRRSLQGAFSAVQLGPGLWQLTSEGPDPARVYLRDAGPDASALGAGMRVTGLEVEWFDEGVTVSVIGTQGIQRFKTGSVLIHEPKAHLYDGLPLASFDADARRFWKRVFRLVRIPGGRLLLGLIARRRRAGTASH